MKIINTEIEINLKASSKLILQAIFLLERSFQNELNQALEYIFKAACKEIEDLSNNGLELSVVSMQVRNIFELYLTARHIYTDKNALNNWFGQMHRDLVDIQNGFIELLKRKNLDDSKLVEANYYLNQTLAQTTFSSSKSFNLKDLAVKFGYEADYNFVYKLSSKLIHPTSLKVNGYAALDENYLLMLHHSGQYFARKIGNLAVEVQHKLVT
jgi:hypothetical protein